MCWNRGTNTSNRLARMPIAPSIWESGRKGTGVRITIGSSIKGGTNSSARLTRSRILAIVCWWVHEDRRRGMNNMMRVVQGGRRNLCACKIQRKRDHNHEMYCI